MKVLFLSTHLNYGGISSYILNLAKELKNRNIEVLVASGGGSLEERLCKFKIRHIKIPLLTKCELNPKLSIAIGKLSNFLHKENIQILHTNTRVSQVVGWMCKKFSNICMITTAHGFYIPRLGRKIFPCWGDKVIAISKAVEDHLIKNFNLSSMNIRLIRNGVDVSRFIPSVKSLYSDEIKRKFNISNGPVIGTISRLSDIKGIEYILRAVKKLKSLYPNIICLIVGCGKEYYNIKNLAKRLDINRNIKIISPLWEIEKMLSVMEVFICTSLQEGLGLSLLEAMGCGIPVIATKVGGIVEIIQNKHNGILIPPADVNSLAENIRILFEDKNLHEKISHRANRCVKNNFNLSKMADLTVEVYQDIL